MNKTNVAVLMGGNSSEYDVSLSSGYQVATALRKAKHKVVPVVISRDGKKWFKIGLTQLGEIAQGDIDKNFTFGRQNASLLKLEDKKNTTPGELKNKIDIVFIALHGPYGEDGKIQGMLELAGIKYTGSGVLASAVGMDKLMFRRIMKSIGVLTPGYISIKKGERITSDVERQLGRPPYFVKPNAQGSSVGASLAKTKEELIEAVQEAFLYDDIVLVDKYIVGKEVTVSILGNRNPVALPVIEIIPKKGAFFDYESKYSKNGSEEIVPARISKKLSKELQKVALGVYEKLGCSGFGRVDFILSRAKPYVLEINTIPGLTPVSLFPKAAAAAGISYTDLIDKITKYGLRR